jgi:CRP/FNR family transcriptional regulator, cyclic AMP receptor protein
LSDLIERLGKVSHFKGLSIHDLGAIVRAGQRIKVSAEAMIFLESEPAAGMYVLFSGKVHLCKLSPRGHQHIVSVIEPVIMFNEVSVLDGGPNPLTAIAVEDCRLWHISAENFQDLMHRFPEIGLGLLRVLARRNRHLLEHFEDLAFRSVLSRTAKLLLSLSENGKRPVIRQKHSIQEMASLISTVPEAISRSLNVIKQRGVIDCSRTKITILQPRVLAQVAQVPVFSSDEQR